MVNITIPFEEVYINPQDSVSTKAALTFIMSLANLEKVYYEHAYWGRHA
jgi:hypothetical protein